MTKSKEFKATILEEGAGYTLSEEIANSFDGFHITTDPLPAEDLGCVVGVIDSAEYTEEEGIVIYFSIYDDDISKSISEKYIFPCPIVLVDGSDGGIIRGGGVYLSPTKSELVNEINSLD